MHPHFKTEETEDIEIVSTYKYLQSSVSGQKAGQIQMYLIGKAKGSYVF